jgi:hypothetical protein
MTLSERQQEFAQNVAQLILFIFNEGYTCTLGEALRTPEMAEIYAKRGTGIKNSMHLKKLAIDLNLFKGGVYLTDTKNHRQFGEYWMSLDPRNRWGGDWDMDHLTEDGEDDGNHYEMKEDR